MTALASRLLACADDYSDNHEIANLLREAAAALSGQEAVGEIAGGAFGVRYFACPEWDKLPIGTKLYTTPQPGDGWRPIAEAPKSVADGSRVTGIYLLGFTFEPDLDFDPQACIDVIWWEPLLPNKAGGRGKWCANAAGDAVECEPTHWMPLPAAPSAKGV